MFCSGKAENICSQTTRKDDTGIEFEHRTRTYYCGDHAHHQNHRAADQWCEPHHPKWILDLRCKLTDESAETESKACPKQGAQADLNEDHRQKRRRCGAHSFEHRVL